MAYGSRKVTVGTSAAQINSTSTEADSVRGTRFSVKNPGPQTIYLGGSDVTTTTGYDLAPGESWADDLQAGEKLYAIAGASQDVKVIEGGL